MSLVIDSSIAAAWLLPDEQSSEADKAIETGLANGLDVPRHFLGEVADVLVISARRGRISAPLDYLAELAKLELREDVGAPLEHVAQAMALAERHLLTVYDAAYLELARRLGSPLATLDMALRRGAADAGVPLFNP